MTFFLILTCLWRAYRMHTLIEGLGDADGIGGGVKVIQSEGHHLAGSHPGI